MASETIVDIVREMRTLGRLDEKSTDKIPRSLQALGLRTFADRIEAAHKQPVTDCNALNTKPAENVNSDGVIYNGAKMREALKCIDNIISHIEVGNVRDILHAYKNIHDRIRIALSAPARNCDRFMDELDAQIEFLNDVWLISVTKDTMLEGDKFENWTEEMKSRYAKWLFAEAKGESK